LFTAEQIVQLFTNGGFASRIGETGAKGDAFRAKFDEMLTNSSLFTAEQIVRLFTRAGFASRIGETGAKGDAFRAKFDEMLTNSSLFTAAQVVQLFICDGFASRIGETGAKGDAFRAKFDEMLETKKFSNEQVVQLFVNPAFTFRISDPTTKVAVVFSEFLTWWTDDLKFFVRLFKNVLFLNQCRKEGFVEQCKSAITNEGAEKYLNQYTGRK
jgi:hypothetical protein